MGEALRLIQAQALPMFERFRTPADFARHAMELITDRENPNYLEAVAYSHGEGKAGVAPILEQMRAEDDLLPDQREMVRRNQQVLLKLRHRPEEAVADPRGWRLETLRGIGFKDVLSRGQGNG